MNEVVIAPEGEWVECSHDECHKMFFQHPFGHKYYTLSDKIGVCPLCICDVKRINGTDQKKRIGSVNDFIPHHGGDLHAGPDTL